MQLGLQVWPSDKTAREGHERKTLERSDELGLRGKENLHGPFAAVDGTRKRNEGAPQDTRNAQQREACNRIPQKSKESGPSGGAEKEKGERGKSVE